MSDALRPAPGEDAAPAPASPAQLFAVFTWLALRGFGGVVGDG